MANGIERDRYVLRKQPLPVRITLAMFLVAAGVGYLTGLIQLHFAHASPGNILPSPDDAAKVYHGQSGPKMTQLERLLEAPETLPFNGTGSMRKAFTEKSSDWKEALKQKPEATIRQEREGERLALLEWIRAGADRKAFEEDQYPLTEHLAASPLTIDFLKVNDQGKEITPRVLSVKSLVESRCATCHGQGGEADKFPLEKYDHVAKYLKEPSSGALSLERLASLTHTHMMAFAVLFGATGLIFAFTSYPAAIRTIFGPWTLFFQVIEIGCWWLSRWDPIFSRVGVVGCGVLVGFGLGVQILGGLFDLFWRKGRILLIIALLSAATIGGWTWLTIISPFLVERGKAAATR